MSGRSIHLRNGLGWVDVSTRQCALPPDGETFSVAGGASRDALTFHVVDLPSAVALVVVDPAAVIDTTEMETIDALLRAHVGTVAFIGPEREGAAVVHVRGGDSSDLDVGAAAAALKAIGGWDETVPIIVNVDRRLLAVTMTHDDAAWHATVARVDDEGLASALDAIVGSGEAVSLVHVNIDRLAAYDDAHGHDAGDLLLARLHGVVRSHAAKSGGRAFRRGIDDLVLLGGIGADDAVAWGEELRQAVAAAKIPLEHREVRHIGSMTISLGIAHAAGPASVDAIMGAAGRALADAKSAGRNTTRCRPVAVSIA